uniref:BRCT domain-containing protein n=1 Tax=Strigamia maritima TaxID=126957 RepID=T1INL0_STRMM
MALNISTSDVTAQSASENEQDRLLEKVVAYVEVRAEDEDRSDAISHFLHLLGAKISKYFNRKVTHVVFKNGKLSTYKKAKLWGVHLVSVSWIERCKKSNSVVDASEYPAIIPEEFTSPFFCGKPKKFKSMVPKITDITDVVISKSLQRESRRREQSRIKRECREFLKLTPLQQAEFKPRLKRFKSEHNQQEVIKIDKALIKRRFSADNASDNSSEMSDGSIGSDEQSWNVPLVERLHNRSLSASFNVTPQLAQNSTTKSPMTKPGKRKLFSTPTVLLNSTPDATPKTKTKSKTTKTKTVVTSKTPSKNVCHTSTSLQLTDSSSSLTDFQLTSNKENEVKKIHKVIKFDEDTPPSPPNDIKNIRCKLLNNSRNVSSPIVFSRTPSVVFTSFGKEETESLTEIVAGFGGYNVVINVDETTTHVVCGTPRRTLSVLFGLARGCWILSQDWVYKSLDKGRWLPETNFELSTEFPGCSDFRFERRKSSAYRQNIFRVVEPMFIGDEISMPKKKLQQLITLCGGRVISKSNMAAIYIGSKEISKKGSTSLTEKWILDSITHNKLQPMDNYRMK